MSQTFCIVRLRVLTAAVGATTSSLLACNTDEVAAIEADNLASATQPIAPADMLKCWITPDTANTDPFFQAHPLQCTAVLPASYPLRPKAYVLTLLKKGGGIAEVALSNDQTVEVTRLLNSDFPVELRWSIRFPSAAADFSGSDLPNYGLRRVAAIASLSQATAVEPLVEKTPFTLWPITLRNPSKSYASLATADYTVSALPFAAGDSTPESNDGAVLKVRGQFGTREAFRAGVFIAPASGSIAVRAVSRAVSAGVDGKIVGPGSYEIVNGAFVHVSRNSDVPPSSLGNADAPADSAPAESYAARSSDAVAPEADAGRGASQPDAAPES